MMRAWLVVLLLSAQVSGATAIRGVGCAPTAEAAVARMLARVEGGNVAEGFRVASIRVDRVRGQRWAMVESCAQPATPMRAIVLPNEDVPGDDVVNARVRIGERVVVVQRGADSQMELSGIAESSAAMGEAVRVRLPRLSEDMSVAAPEIRCRVVGQGTVEALR